MTKHTPGPWNYHVWGTNSGKHFGIETADHRHGICGVSPNGNASTLLTIEQHEANARLIAAAPELLAACQSGLDGLLAAFPHAPRIPDILHPIINQVRAAIAKATGETV
jgi:hypothetical protein